MMMPLLLHLEEYAVHNETNNQYETEERNDAAEYQNRLYRRVSQCGQNGQHHDTEGYRRLQPRRGLLYRLYFSALPISRRVSTVIETEVAVRTTPMKAAFSMFIESVGSLSNAR